MGKCVHILLFIISFILVASPDCAAQNNLSVAYSNANSVPEFINVCGEAEAVAVTINVDGFQAQTRENIIATLHLVEGVQLVEFDENQSSAGVSLMNASDLNNPVFAIPDLSPSGTTSVNIHFSIRANCDFTDTLSINDQLQVFDVWEFQYDIGSNQSITESDPTAEYRDAFAVPFFTIDIVNPNPPARVGECFLREIQVSNSSLDGFVDSLQYSIVQGAGIYIQELNANGIPLALSTIPLGFSDSLVTAILDGSHFQSNIIGNGDPFFDPNEMMTITELYCVVDCDAPSGSLHTIAWGCDGSFCEESLTSDFVILGEGSANVQVTTSGSIPNQNTGYCAMGQSTVTFKNNGVEFDDGFAAMIDVELGIGLGGAFALNHNGYEITGMRIAGLDIVNFSSFNEINNHPQFATDPDGAGGLSDFDGDGFFDDLELGQTIEVTAFYEFDCSLAQNFDLDDECVNDFFTTLNARIDYTNSCGERLTRLQNNYLRPANNNSRIENFSQPDAFLEDDVFFVTHSESRSVRFFDWNCNGEEIFIVKVVVPAGITLETAQTQLLKNEVSEVPLLSSSISGDTVTLTYDASFSPFLNGDYDLTLAFTADCTTELGPTVFPTTFEFYCPPCDCRHLWYCGNLLGPVLHAESPPCPIDVIPECSPGVKTIAFDVNRTTFGFEDESFLIPFDQNEANKKVAISCDSVEMRILSVIGEGGIGDSLGMVITYSNVDGSNDPAEIFQFGEGLVRFSNGDTEFTCPVGPNVQSIQTNNGFKTLRFDLDACVTDLEFNLVEGDTVEFLAYFAISPDGPYNLQFRRVPNLRGFGFITENGIDKSCDNFGDIFTIAKNRIAFDFPNNSDFPIGCEVTPLEYRLITVNNGFKDFFGDELRPASKVDSLIFDFDPELLNAFDEASVTVSIPGHPIFGNDFFDLPPLTDFPEGHYVAAFDTLLQVPTLNEVQTYTFNLTITLVPSCRSVFGSSNSDNFFDMDSKIYFKDRYYAQFIGDGSCMEEVIDSVESSIVYNLPPTFSLTPLSNTNYVLTGDTAVWTVQLCNNSFFSDAGLTWLSVEDQNGILEVISLEDITNPASPEQLPIQSFGNSGTKTFALTNGLLKANGINAFEDICNIIRIKALMNDCENFSFQVNAGWNCQDYDVPDWTPELYPPCEDISLGLSLTFRNPFIDANVIDQPLVNPNICDTSSLTILMRNIDLGALFDLRSQFILPLQGANLIPGSMQIAYPSSAPFQNATADPTFINTTLQGHVYQYDDFAFLNTFLHDNGMPGFNPSNPTDSNEIKLKFSFVTDCDFQSNSLAFYNLQGFKGCGEPSNFEAGESFPIIISGTEPDLTKLFDVAFSPQSFLVPNALSTLEIIVTNLTPTPSDESDRVSLILPLDVTYEAGTSMSIVPASWMIEEPEIELQSGLQKLTWKLPEDLLENEQARFSFQVNAPDLDCDAADEAVLLQTVARTELFCESENLNCDVETITSTTGVELTPLPIGGTVVFAFQDITSTCANEDEELLNISGDLVTSLGGLPNANFSIQLYFDANGNGIVDPDELAIEELELNGNIAPNTPLPFEFITLVETDQICGLILQLTTDDIDLCGNVEVPVITPQILNAGVDQIFCEAENGTLTAQIGEENCSQLLSYEYTWTAILPAMQSDLSNFKVPNPIVTFDHSATGTDTLVYVLETERPGCSNSTFDTVQIILAEDVVIGPNADISIFPTEDTLLIPNIISGVSPFSYEWEPASSLDEPNSPTPNASPLETTEYTVTITDVNGCSGTGTFTVIVVTPVTAMVSPADTSICTDASVQLLASGGEIYSWLEDVNNPPGGMLSATDIPNPVFSGGLPGNTYQFQVIVSLIAFPGFPDTADVSITIFDQPVINAGSDVTICLGDQIQLNASANGGDGNYTYDWSPQVLFGQNTPNPIVQPGISTEYIISLIDGNGCQDIDTVLVTVEDCECIPATVTNINTTPAACGEMNGFALVEVEGDEADYNFIWAPDEGTPFGNGNGRTEISSGEYLVTIQNIADPTCETTATITVLSEDGPEAFAVTTPAVCEAETGTASLTPSDLAFIWEDGNTDAVRNNLAAGLYFVTVSEVATPDCFNVIEVLIGDENDLEANVNIIMQPDCGVANGVVTMVVLNGSGFYTYSWPGGTATQDSLASGIYTITVTDTASANCTLPITFVLSDDVPQATVSITDTTHVTCFGEANGGINFDIQLDNDFNAPADTIISNGFQNFENQNLPAGNYCLIIEDSNGCVAGGACFEITQPEPILIELMSTPACGSGGEIITNVEGGQPPYTYNWGDLVGNNDPKDRVNLQEGIYQLSVTDANDCAVAAAVNVLPCGCEPPVLESVGTTQANCGISNGTAIVEITADESFYNFNWQPDLGIANPIGNERTNLPAGDYVVQIIFQNNSDCFIEVNLTIDNEEMSAATATTTPAACQSPTGSATLLPIDFDYFWEDGSTDSIRNDLLSGIHFVTVSDPNFPDCQNVLEVVIGQENPLTADVIVNDLPDCGESNGIVTIEVNGGSGNYDFSWPSNTNTQDSLAAGLYTVTVTDLDTIMCELPVLFVLADSIPAAEITINQIQNISCFGANDGGIDFSINFENGFAAPADTLISNGLGEFENGNLSPGNYCMIIYDANGCVAGGECFEIEQPTAISVEYTSFADCGTDGGFDITVEGGMPPYNFNWETVPGNPTSEDQFGLSNGFYNLTIQDQNSCVLILDSLVVDACLMCDVYPTDSVIFQAINCESKIELCLEIHNDIFDKYRFFVNGQLFTGDFNHCGFDFLGSYNYAVLFGQGNSGPYQVVDWTVDGTSFSGEFQDIQGLIDSMNVWNPSGNWTLHPTNPFIIGGDANTIYETMEVLVINFGLTSFIPFSAQLTPTAFGLEFGVGTYEVIAQDTITGCSDTIFTQVVCTVPDTIFIEIIENEMDTICFSNNELLGSIDTLYNDCEDGTFVNYEVFNDTCFILTGLEVGMETACAVACDSLGICDTTYLIINVLDAEPFCLTDTILINQVAELCFDTIGLDLTGNIVSIENTCQNLSGNATVFELDEDNFCLIYTGIDIGTDTACVKLCDDLGNCDSLNVCVSVVPGVLITDTIFIYNDTVTFCLDTTLLPGTITSIEDLCPETNGDQVIFEIDTINYCITYTGIEIGVDTACILLLDDLGNALLTNFQIEVIQTTPETFCDSVFIRMKPLVFLDTTELPGNIISMDNVCEDLGEGNVSFYLNDLDYSVQYEGLEIGKDTACIVLCDDLGFCDTTHLCILVEEYPFPPDALFDELCPPNDTLGTPTGTPIVIDVLRNDTTFGGLVDFYISEPPISQEAEVIINLDNSITYIPNPPHCDYEDEFSYVICNPNGCDTTQVCIFIKCQELTVFNAISPNNDNVNDLFWIAKIQEFPDNRLTVYNRWGNLVYESESYQNDWPGTWSDDKELPDGTYFYILEWRDQGRTNIQRGYIELFR